MGTVISSSSVMALFTTPSLSVCVGGSCFLQVLERRVALAIDVSIDNTWAH